MVVLGRGGGFFIFFAPQTKAPFLSGLKRGGLEHTGKSWSSLKEGDFSCF